MSKHATSEAIALALGSRGKGEDQASVPPLQQEEKDSRSEEKKDIYQILGMKLQVFLKK
jgi:hypothetical protein